ncbi:MAG: 1-acyl-sn-glycerol-3-phosphate acyltransferase [bacterium]|nr:1-acyl-sn-glycerol-3-phosphate acyltransferase [bacterium]
MSALRSLILWVLVVSITAAFCIALLPWAMLGRRRFVFRLARVWATTLLAVSGIQVVVENSERLLPAPDSKQIAGAIQLANHQSFLDVVAFCYALPGPLSYMAKSSLFRIPIFGQVLKGLGTIPVDRSKRASSGRAMGAAVRAIKAGQRVMIFPEGTRSRADGSLMPFKRGAFVLARDSAVPVQSLTVSGAGSIMPAGQKGVWIQRIYRGTIRIVVHPVMAPEEIAQLDAVELSDRIYRLIDRPLDRLGVLAEIETVRF